MSAEIVRVSDNDDTFMVTLAGEDEIHTTVTSSASVVTSWLSDIRFIHRRRLRRLIVGLDTEWRPNFRPNQNNPVALLQLCVGRRCLLYQILHADYVPDSLSNFLSDDRFTVVGVGVEDDVERLQEEYGVEVECSVVDLRDLAAEAMGREEMRRFGLQNLVREVMGLHLEKDRRVRLSRWDRERLTGEQMAYAAVDGFASFEVGRRLMAGEY